MSNRTWQIAAVATAFVVVSCATPPAPPPPPVPVPEPVPPPPLPPPPPPPPPPVIPTGIPPGPEQARLDSLADRFLSFAAETTRGALPASIANAPSIINSVDRSVTYLGPDLVDGARAAAIVAAASTPEFIAGIDQIGTPMGRDAFIARLVAEPAFAATIPGALEAATRAGGVLAGAFTQIETAAAYLHRQSYDMQRQRWTQTPVDKQARLTAVAARWLQPWSAEGRLVADATIATPPVPVDTQLLAAAALLVVRDDAGAITQMAPGSGSTCARRTYLNLRQCLAAGRFPYEQTFCLSVHAYKETLTCLQEATNKTPFPVPGAVAVSPPPPPPAAPVPVRVGPASPPAPPARPVRPAPPAPRRN